MKNWLIGKILAWAGKKLDGYKTKIGGVGLILVGVTGIIGQIFPDQGLPVMDLETAFGAIAAGLAALGIGHKVEKAKAVIQAQGDRPSEVVKGPAPLEPAPKWDGRASGQFP